VAACRRWTNENDRKSSQALQTARCVGNGKKGSKGIHSSSSWNQIAPGEVAALTAADGTEIKSPATDRDQLFLNQPSSSKREKMVRANEGEGGTLTATDGDEDKLPPTKQNQPLLNKWKKKFRGHTKLENNAALVVPITFCHGNRRVKGEFSLKKVRSVDELIEKATKHFQRLFDVQIQSANIKIDVYFLDEVDGVAISQGMKMQDVCNASTLLVYT